MNTKKVTNWFNWNEWRSMVDEIYNNTDDDEEVYRRAFNRILAWESRDANLSPALVGLKELLVTKMHKRPSIDSPIEETYFYQSCLAMAIVRFVNFVTEPYQKGIFAKPIKSIANEIGLPDWIVNLRHNATHFNLPSLEILENARDYLYEWVKINYVDTYKEISMEGSIVNNIKAYIRELFLEYIKARFNKVLIEEKKKSQKLDISILTNKIETVTEQFRNETFEILIEYGFLIPNVEQLESIGIVVEEFLEMENILVPKPILKIWKEFLLFCNEKNLVGLLFQSILHAYKLENYENSPNTNLLRKKLLLSWILSLLDSTSSYKNENTKQLQLEFEFNPKQVLNDILISNPNRYTLIFMKQAKYLCWLKKCVDQEEVEKLISLVEYINETNMKDEDPVASDESPADIFNGMNNELADFYAIFDQFQNSFNNDNVEISHSRQQKINRKSDWILVDDVDWNHENLKLGLIDDQNYATFDLNLERSQRDIENNQRNLSINEAAAILSGSKIKIDSADFTISHLADIHDDSFKRIKNDLVKNYWGY